MRMRTQTQVLAAIKADDPETNLTAWALRQMVLTGVVPSVQVGRKRLIDLDRLPEYLTPTPAAVTHITSGTIRRVDL